MRRSRTDVVLASALLALLGCSDGAAPASAPAEQAQAGTGGGQLGSGSGGGGAGQTAGGAAAAGDAGLLVPGGGAGEVVGTAGSAGTPAGGAAGSGSLGGGGGAGGNGSAASPQVREGCESVTHDGHLYALCRDAKVPFPDARKDCEAMGLQLIRLDSAAESAWIYEAFYAKPTSGGDDGSQMWVGASDNLVEGEWRWLIGGDVFWRGKVDGAPVGGLYTNWGRAHGVGAQDQPNDSHSAEGEDCLVIRGPSENEAGHWTDIGCGTENMPPVPQARIAWYTCEAE